jgi:hypothetical protein
MADDIIASARSMTTVADGQYVAIGVPKAAITPATLTAMVGMAQGGGAAIDIAPKVNEAMTNLQTVASSSNYPANVNAQAALNTLTTIQGKLFNKDDAGGFGAIVGKVQSHISNSNDVLNSTTFLKDSNYSDFGSGITDMSSMGDRGMTNVFGSLPGAGKAMSSFGTMFNGIDVKRFGTPSGLVESLQKNKLANATGVNQKLADAGVDLNDIHNPVYADKISSVLTNIKDPAAINTTADQFGINNPFAGLPSYTGSDSSLYNTQNALGGSSATAPTATTIPSGSSSTFGAPTTTGFPTASGTSRQGGSFGSEQIQGQTGTGIQGLKDLSDYTKTANPADTAGFAGMDSLTSKFKDMGAGSVVDGSKASSFFSSIQKVPTPLTNAANPTLNSLITEHTPFIQNLIGSSTVPSAQDFLGPVAGCSELDALADGVTDDKVAALNTKLASTNTFLSAAGITTATAPATQTLGGVMGFATKLHTYGKDTSTGGIGSMLKNMANSSTKYGEAVKASLAEGKNNDLLSANGIGPLKTNPFEGVPAYAGTDSSLATNSGAKLLGGGGDSTPPIPSRGTVSGSSTQGGSFGSEQIQGQTGTGTAGLRGTPFDVTGGR